MSEMKDQRDPNHTVPARLVERKRRLLRGKIFACLLFALLVAPTAFAHIIENSVYISIRVYDGVDLMDMDMDEAIRHAVEGYLPIISASEGFIAYYWLPADDTLATISVFASAEEASASNDAARDYIVEHNLAAQLPNQPRIIEGSVAIGFVEMLDGMTDGDVSSLHASVRIYDGFQADDLDEFVTIVDDGFLPIMRETAGFFGYYLMNNGAGTLAAISIFDSEASAMASNSAAADFVAENLAAFLPNAPSITSGPLGIAVLAAVNDGANLVDNMMDDSVFASVRVYDGVDPADQDEIARLVNEGFLPIMRGSDGFIAYLLLLAGDTLAAVSAFETVEQAAASNDAARDFVAENLAPLLPNPPMILQGSIDLAYFTLLDEMMIVDDITSLYASLRLYRDVDMSQRAESNTLVESIFLPILQETQGFWGYLRWADGVSRRAALSIYDSEENSLAANDKAAAFVAEYLTDRPDEAPIRVNGRLGVAALAEIGMGENLVRTMMDG